MNTIRDIVDQVVQRASAGEIVAFCAVVATRGSTPQRAGATMLVTFDGQTIGTLGGGCVEAEVRTRALQLLTSRDSRLLTFRLDNDYGWDDGLVCGGAMDIAVKVVAAPDLPEWNNIALNIADNKPASLLLNVRDDSGTAQQFTHTIDPVPTLLIAGAGHVGYALADAAQIAGFNIVVIDDRADLTTADRFPNAKRIIGEIDDELSRWPIDEHTYVVIVTRGHRHDGRALAAVVASRAKYVGLIGSKRKVVTILRDLNQQGVPREKLLAVHAPIGLDIHAITPGEIALSIVAQLIAVRRGAKDEAVGPMKIPPAKLGGLLDRS